MQNKSAGPSYQRHLRRRQPSGVLSFPKELLTRENARRSCSLGNEMDMVMRKLRRCSSYRRDCCQMDMARFVCAVALESKFHLHINAEVGRSSCRAENAGRNTFCIWSSCVRTLLLWQNVNFNSYAAYKSVVAKFFSSPALKPKVSDANTFCI